MRQYVLQDMGGERAKKILEDCLAQLSIIDTADMTTFELGILHRCATNPPDEWAGAEHQINNGE